jgi:type IV pilus assembly protein PilA
MVKLVRSKRSKGFTLIELLVVAAILGVLIAIAVPNLLGARSSANEASAKKVMTTIRDAETTYYEQDIDDNGVRDYTNIMDKLANAVPPLLDSSIQEATKGANAANAVTALAIADCKPKANYCFGVDPQGAATLPQEFGWRGAPVTDRHGKHSVAVYTDGVVRCEDVTGDFDLSVVPTSGGCN